METTVAPGYLRERCAQRSRTLLVACRSRRAMGLFTALLAFGLASSALAAPVLIYQSITDSPDPVAASSDLTYNITIENTATGGSDDANNVQVVLDLPTGLTYQSVSGAGVSCTGTDPVTCSLGIIAESSSRPFSVALRTGALASGTSLVTDFDLTSTEITTPVETSRTTTVQNYLSYTVLADAPDPVLAGEQLTFSVTVENTRTTGPDDMNDVVLRLPSVTHLTFDSDTLPGTCAPSGGAIVCDLGDLADNGDDFIGTLVYDVAASAPAATVLAQDFDLSSDEQPAPGVDADLTTTVATEANLAVTLAGPLVAVPGNNLVYTVDVDNNGPSDAQSVELNLSPISPLPTPSSVTGSGCSALPCVLGVIAAGDSRSVTVTYALPADYHLDNGNGNIVNSATATTTTTDPDTADNTEGESTPIEPRTDLSVSITSVGATATPGEPILYTITATNGGPSATDRVRLIANPTGLLSLVFVPDEGIFSATNQPGANWTGLDLDSGESAALVFGAWVDPAFVDLTPPEQLVAQVQIAVVSPYTDPGAGSNNGSEVDTIARVADLSITKDNGLEGVAPNLAVPYSIVVSNSGPSDVKAAAVDDDFDARFSSVTWICSASRPLTELATLEGISIDGLDGARRAAISSDGRHVYVAAETDNGVGVFARNVTSGALTLLEVERETTLLDGTSSVVVSADGRHVYATSHDDDAVVHFDRDDNPVSPTFGQLTRIDAVQSGTTLDGAADLAIAPDGRHVYVVASTSNTLVVLSRNLGTGTLTSAFTISDAVATPLAGAAAVAVTPDGRHVLVAAAGEDSLLSFTRNLSTGALAIADVETDSTRLDGAGALAVSPDGGYVYVTGEVGNTLAVYDRHPGSGLLGFKDLEQDGVGLVESMNKPRGVFVSPDGRTVYVAGEGTDDSITIFDRVTSGGGQGTVTFSDSQVLTDVFGLAMSPGGEHLYAVSNTGNSLTHFAESDGAVCDGGSGDPLAESIDLPAKATLTFSVTAVVAGGAMGTIDNTATVTAPAGVTDATGTPDPLCTNPPASATNNSCSDRDDIRLLADLVTEKSTSALFAIPGESLVYTLVVSSAGPNAVTGVQVTDDLTNASLASATWTCLASGGAACGAVNGSGDISQLVSLPQNSSVTYTITVTLTASATGVPCVETSGDCIFNAASATLPAGYLDSTPLNASSSVETLISREADLRVLKEVLTSGVAPGGALDFRVTVTNCGPSNVSNALVNDAFASSYFGPLPGPLPAPTWTCIGTNGSCPASGSGSLNAVAVTLAAGAPSTCAGAGKAVFTILGSVDDDAEGVLSNTALVSAPSGVSDPTPGNNSSTVNVVLTATADLAIVKDDNSTEVVAGEPIVYTLAVFNNGPDNVSGAHVFDPMPAALQDVSWTCSSASPAAGTLRLIEEEIDNVPPVDGLAGAHAVVVAADGNHVYAVGAGDNAVVAFARDEATGELEFVESLALGAGAADLALSPDGNFLYAVSSGAGAIAVFGRNPNLGTLTFLQSLDDSDADGLANARGVAVSPDGEHVYVTGADDVAGGGDDTIAIFHREEVGTLDYLGMVQDGASGVDGLAGAAGIAVSPDGEHVYVAGFLDDSIALFRRDTDDESANFGLLTYVEKLSDGDIQGSLTLDLLDGAIDLVVTADGRFVHLSSQLDDAVSTFRRNTEASDTLNFGRLDYLAERHQGDAGNGGVADGLTGARGLAVDADGEHLYVAGEGDSAIAVFARNTVTGSLKFLESRRDGTTGNCVPIPLECELSNAGGASGVAVSGDGLHVYLASASDDALVAFARDGAPPTFAFAGGQPSPDPVDPAFVPPQPVRDGFYGVDGLAGASGVASADNTHVFATGLADQALVSFLSASDTGELTFVERKRDGEGGIDGLEAPTALAVHGLNVYVVSSSVSASENALTVFSYDGGGHLTRLQTKRQGGIDLNGVIDGLFGASSVVVSPDGQHVYVASRFPGAIAVFARDGLGLLQFVEVKKTGVGGVTNLGGAHGVAISTDGAHLYATASVDDAVVVFARGTDGGDPATFGRLTQIQVQPNLGGLDRAIGVAVSTEPDALGSRNVYVTGHTSDAMVVFRRNVDDSSPDWGKLTRLQLFTNGVDNVEGLNGARAVALSSDGKQVYVASEDDDALAIFSREEVGGTLVFVEARFDGVDGVDGIDQAYSVAVVREGKHVYVAGLGDNAVAEFARSSASRCTGAGVGNVDDLIDIAAFGQLIYTVRATVDPAATADIVNTATVTVPVEVDDPGPDQSGEHEAGTCPDNTDPSNDSCTDIDTVRQRADLEVRKTDGTDVAIPGEELTYTLTVFNRGPSNIVGATVEDDLSSIFPDGATWSCVASPSGAVSFVGSFGEGDALDPGPGTIQGLDGATDVAISPDGEHVYATGLASDAVVVFALDSGSGELSYLQTVADGVGGVDGLDGAGAIEVSPDGSHVYVLGQLDDTVVVFERDEVAGPGFGLLSLLQIVQSSTNPAPIPGALAVTGLDEPVGLALDPDGENVYVAAANSSAVTVFDRNANELDLGNFGLLAWLASAVDGAGGVDGLAGASAVAVSANGANVYATGENDNAIAVFSRAAGDGTLAFVERKVDGISAQGLAAPRAVVVTNDGLNVYVAGSADNAVAVFARNTSNGTLSFLDAVVDGVDGVEGLAGVSGLAVTSDDFHVYATGTGEDALVALRRELTLEGRLEFVAVSRNGHGAVDRLLGPAGVATSPSGAFVLSAARLGDAVVVYSRPTDSSCSSGSGLLLSDVVNIAAGSQIVYTITGVVAPDACPLPYPCSSTDLINTATVELPAGATDPDPDDNEDIDTDNLSPRVDLEITKSDGESTVQGLAGATAIALSPLGTHLYATGGVGDGLAVFAREPATGELDYIESFVDNADGIDGLNGASWVLLSALGRHVYVTGAADNAVVVFERDVLTGELSYLETEQNGVGGVSGMLAPTGAALASNGRHLYVAGHGSSAIAIFERDAAIASPTFGLLTYLAEVPDGFEEVDGLGAVRAITLSSLGEHLYAVGESDNAVAVFSRDADTGLLTFLEMQSEGVDGVSGMVAPRGLDLSPDGKHLYVSSFGSGAVAIFARDDDSGSDDFGRLTFVDAIVDGEDGADGLAGAQGIKVVPDPPPADQGGQHVYVSGASEDEVAIFARDDDSGSADFGKLTFVAVAKDGASGVSSLERPVALAVSPDAQHVYAAASDSDALVVFERDWDSLTETGSGNLAFVEAEVEGSGTVAPGSPIAYEIRVTNHGPSSVEQARVMDIFPGDLENVTFTCQTTPGATCFDGSGDLDQLVKLPVGGSVLFLASGTLKPGISGTVVNTATVTAPNGVIELDPSDNSATDDDTVLSPVADIVVEKIACTDGDPAEDCPGSATSELVPGTDVFFQVAVTNDGPSDADGVRVRDVLQEILTEVSWSCVAEPEPGLLSALAVIADGSGVPPTPPRCPLLPVPPPITNLNGLDGARAVTLSSDGRNVYVGGGVDDAIVVFSRDLRNGSLEFVGMVKDGDLAYDANCVVSGGPVDGLDGLTDLVASPEGGHLYATGEGDDALVVFQRDAQAGELIFKQILRDGVGANGLGNVLGVEISPDGKHIYTAAASDNGVGVFLRNLATGQLSFDSIKVDGGVEGLLTIDGLAGASDVAISPEGAHLYATGAVDGSIAVFSRNAATGKLTFLQFKDDGVGGIDGLAGAAALALDDDGAHLYAAGAVDGGLAVFSRNATTGLLTFLEAHLDGAAGVEGLAGARAVRVSPDGEHVYVAGAGDSALAIFARDAATGRLEFVAAAADGAGGLDGLAGVAALALSPDGEQIYATGQDEDELAVLRRHGGSRCTAAGSGDLDDVAEIAAGGSAVYTLRAHLAASAFGTLTNTAMATTAANVADSDLANNSDTVEISLTPVVDLVVTKDDGLSDAVPGTDVTYTISVTNLGPSDLVGASLVDDFPAELLDPEWSCAPSQALGFVEMEQNGVAGGGGLVGDFAIAASPDPDGPDGPLAGGSDVYVGSRKSQAIAHFHRDVATAELTLVTSYADGAPGIDGLNGFGSLALSPDGRNVYATGGVDNAIVVFDRDLTTGALTFREARYESEPAVDGLEGAFGVAVSPDGRHVYVTGQVDDTLAVFARNETTGALTFVEREKDGFGGLELGVLDGVTALAVSPDGKHVVIAGPLHDKLVVFQRDATTGEVSFVGSVQDGVDGVDGLDTVQGLVISHNGQFVYAAGLSDDSIAAFSRDADSGDLEFLAVFRNGVGGVVGLDGVRSLALSPDGQFLFAAGYNSDTVAVFSRHGVTGLLTELEVELDGAAGVNGLDGARSLTMSGDGRDLYVVGEHDNAVAAFRRSGRAVCGVSGLGDIADLIQIAVDGSLSYLASATIEPCAVGSLTNTATVVMPDGTTNLGDDSASDADVLTPFADLSIVKSNGVSEVVAGTSVIYTITVANVGPSCSSSALVTDVVPAELLGPDWTCLATGGGACVAAGAGSLSEIVAVPPGAEVVFTLIGDLDPAATGVLVNTATVATEAGVVDSNPGDNSSTDSDPIVHVADLAIEKLVDPTTVEVLSPLTFTLTVTNLGPSVADAIVVTDFLPGGVSVTTAAGAGWSCIFDSLTVSCTMPLLAPGVAPSIVIDAVAPSEPGSAINTGTVAAGSIDPLSSNDTDLAPFTVVLVEAPRVARLDSVPAQADSEITLMETVALEVTGLVVEFTETVDDPLGDTDPDDVTNPANFLLQRAGGDGVFTTAVCGPALGDDIRVPFESVTYSVFADEATLALPDGDRLSEGLYQLLVCGSTTIRDLSGNALDGNDDGVPGDDYVLYFRIQTENRLARPYWDFATDPSAWNVSLAGANQIDATTPDASGFFLSKSLSMRRLTGSGTLSVSQCVPTVADEGDVIRGRASVVSGAGSPAARVRYEYFSAPGCLTASLLLAGESLPVTGAAWSDRTLALPDRPPTAISERIYFRGEGASGQPFEIRFDDLHLLSPLFADGFESGDESDWDAVVGGAQ